MRPLLRLACLVVLVAAPAFAGDDAPRCAEDGFETFPRPGAVVPVNSRFILEGIGPQADQVWSLIGQSLVLRAGDDATTVQVLKGWKSKEKRAAVILKPRAFLKSGREYRLEMGKLDATMLHRAPNGAVWTTGKGPDLKSPVWDEKPAVAEGKYTTTATGKLITQLLFRFTLKDESPAYLTFSIRRARGPIDVQTYFVPVQGNEVVIGHDECSGSFSFDDGRAYRAQIEGFDAAGNPASPKLKEMEFHSPRPGLQ